MTTRIVLAWIGLCVIVASLGAVPLAGQGAGGRKPGAGRGEGGASQGAG